MRDSQLEKMSLKELLALDAKVKAANRSAFPAFAFVEEMLHVL